MEPVPQEELTSWLTDIVCRHLYTVPRFPQFNGFAENFVYILESAVTWVNLINLEEPEKCIDNFVIFVATETSVFGLNAELSNRYLFD